MSERERTGAGEIRRLSTHDSVVVGVVGVLYALAWCWAVRHGTGWLEADAASHYLGSRFALSQPYLLVDVWQRPLKTLLYCLPAHWFGRAGVQAISLIAALWCAVAAGLIGRRLGVRRPAVAAIFCLGMPLMFLHACSELTELPFAAVLAGAMLLAMSGRWNASAVLFGLLPLGRPEGFVIVAAAALLFGWHRRWAGVVLLAWGVVAWSVGGWLLSGQPDGMGGLIAWLPRHWPYSAASVYAAGSVFQFVALLPMLVGPVALPAVVAGCAGLAKRREERGWSWVVLALTVGTLGGHSLLYRFGLMASNGELRYLLVAAPLWGVCAAAGWEWLGARLRKIGWPAVEPVRLAAYSLAVPVLVNQFVWGVVPVRNDDDWVNAGTVAKWYQTRVDQQAYPRVMCAHPGVWVALDRCNIGAGAVDWTAEHLTKPTAGTVLIWDDVYGRFNADARRKGSLEMIEAAGWREVAGMRLGRPGAAGRDAHQWRVYLSPEIEAGSAARGE